jgi:hypothetical protein
MPGDFFLLAADCVHIHTYDHPHYTDIHGNNGCGCCLKRVYNKGTNKETTRWVHNTLVFSFVFTGGLKIPVYRYSIHAKQVINLEGVSDEKHKQECELTALKTCMPVIRKAFPRMNLVLLLDGLYANRPVIRLMEEHKCGYIIVRKDGCLPSLGAECDEHCKHSNHRKNCTKHTRKIYKGWNIEQYYEWHNSKYLGEGVSTNVLRFRETRTKEGREEQTYKSEWLFSWRLSANNCESSAHQARSRWEIEDIFNTSKHRGYKLNHDYSRNPRSCFNWQGLSFFAFGIFELFRYSEVVKQRTDLSQMALAEKLLGQLLYKGTNEIFSEEQQTKKIQFRYDFITEKALYQKFCLNKADVLLSTA